MLYVLHVLLHFTARDVNIMSDDDVKICFIFIFVQQIARKSLKKVYLQVYAVHLKASTVLIIIRVILFRRVNDAALPLIRNSMY